jgi:hypothetical protein
MQTAAATIRRIAGYPKLTYIALFPVFFRFFLFGVVDEVFVFIFLQILGGFQFERVG